jgi:hypothetical protein
MDIQPQSTQPISDDQELAKVLAGVNADANEAETAPVAAEMQPPVPPVEPPVVAPAPEPMMPTAPAPISSPVAIPVAGELDGVKQAAITELRPLVDKLTLPPEEKFDTYLLLIRSTDDKSLIGPAHEAAKMISDETRRAQALLDVIKEIDFLSGSQAA